MAQEKVKIEVQKSNGIFYYTGRIEEKGDWLHIHTTRGEKLQFRKQQINQIRNIEGDTNERKS